MTDTKCGTTSGYTAHRSRGEVACQPCKDANAASGRAYRRTAIGREITLAVSRKADIGGLRNKRRHDKKRARTTEQADADFMHFRPNGKACRGCGELLPMDAFSRSWPTVDGRYAYCKLNGCAARNQKLKRDLKLRAHWLTLDIDHTICVYCLSAPAEELEHFVPRAKGGTDDFSNLFPACIACNRGQNGKHDRLPFEWLATAYPDRIQFFQNLFKETQNV